VSGGQRNKSSRATLLSERAERQAEILQSQEALPGVVTLILEAKESGMKMGIASSPNRKWFTKYFIRPNLIQHFAVQKCAEYVTHTKTYPDSGHAVLEALGIALEEAIDPQDSISNVKVVKSADNFCVAVPNWTTKKCSQGIGRH
jgi:putative hydrolase of the HAD superfamily